MNLFFNYYYSAIGKIQNSEDFLYSVISNTVISKSFKEINEFSEFLDVQKYNVLTSHYGLDYLTQDVALSLKK